MNLLELREAKIQQLADMYNSNDKEAKNLLIAEIFELDIQIEEMGRGK